MDIMVVVLQALLKLVKQVAGDSVRLECKEDKIRVSVLSNDLWMEVIVDHGCEEPICGSCPVYFPYKDLAQLISGFDKPEVIQIAGNGITYKNITYELGKSKEFSVAKPIKSTIALDISGLKNVMPFVLEEPLRVEIGGVNVKADGNLSFSGTDGRVLKQVEEGKTRSKFDVIIPYEAARLLCRSQSDRVRFGRSKTKLSFEYDNVTIVTKYTDRPYPAVEQVFDTVKDDITVTVDRAMLMEKVFDVARVLGLRDKYPNLGILFKAVGTKSLELSAKYKHGIATTTIEAEVKGAAKFMLNPNRLYTILDSTCADRVTFELSDWDGEARGPVPPIGVVGAENERMAIMQMAFSEPGDDL